jgi:hypothetical protein
LGVPAQSALERHCTQSPVAAQNWPAVQAKLQTPASPAWVIVPAPVDPPVDAPLEPVPLPEPEADAVPEPEPPLVPLAAPDDPLEPPVVVVMEPLPQAFRARPNAATRRPVEGRTG